MITHKVPENLFSLALLKEDERQWGKHVRQQASCYPDRRLGRWCEKQLKNLRPMPKLRRALVFYYQLKPFAGQNLTFPIENFGRDIAGCTHYTKSTISRYKDLLIDYGIMQLDERLGVYRLVGQRKLWEMFGIFTEDKKQQNPEGRHYGKGKGLYQYQIQPNGRYTKMKRTSIVRITVKEHFLSREEFLNELASAIVWKQASRKEQRAKTDGRRSNETDSDTECRLLLSSCYFAKVLGFKGTNTGYKYRKALKQAGKIAITKAKRRITESPIKFKQAKETYNELGYWSDFFQGYLKYLAGHVYVINTYSSTPISFGPASRRPFTIGKSPSIREFKPEA